MEIIARPRRSGKTSFLINHMREAVNTNYILIVHNVPRRDQLRNDYPDLSDRIKTAYEVMGGLCYRDTKFLVDEIELCLPDLIRRHIDIKAFTVSLPEREWDN